MKKLTLFLVFAFTLTGCSIEPYDIHPTFSNPAIGNDCSLVRKQDNGSVESENNGFVAKVANSDGCPMVLFGVRY